MRIAIVNDTLMAIEALRRVVTLVYDYEVAWIAQNGAQAVSKCIGDPPDLVLMDIIMPVMDGVEATRQIMKHSPCAIVIVTASVKKNSAKVFEAMGYGALDVVSTPILGTLGQPEMGKILLDKIATIAKLINKVNPKTTLTSRSTTAKETRGTAEQTLTRRRDHPTTTTLPSTPLPPLIVIGASTGGPKALATILATLPAHFQAAIVIIQHVDVSFAAGLVKWLNEQTLLTVSLAAEGNRLEGGKIFIAGTNDHLLLRSNLTLTYTKEPQDYPYRPSVDVFFKSVAQHWTRKGIGILLTGMGRDGAQGLGLLRARGWHTIAQDRESSIVYGMPKAAIERNAAVEVLPLTAIAPTLIKRLVGNY